MDNALDPPAIFGLNRDHVAPAPDGDQRLLQVGRILPADDPLQFGSQAVVSKAQVAAKLGQFGAGRIQYLALIAHHPADFIHQMVQAIQPPGPEAITKQTLMADHGIGWRYARTSSDYNPIHLWNFGARMFGFNQAIAHGMWSMARSLSAMPAGTFDSPCRVDVVFKRPVSIPAPLTLETWRTPAGDGFALKGANKGKVHLAGSITPLRTTAG